MYDLRTNLVRWETNVRNGVCSIEFDRKDIEMNKMVTPPRALLLPVPPACCLTLAGAGFDHTRKPVQSVRLAHVRSPHPPVIDA